MWDPRYPILAAERLNEQHRDARRRAAAGPGPLRRGLGVALVRLGERLAAAPTPSTPRPAPLAP